MLTKLDLKWTCKLFSLYTKLGIIPVTFKPLTVGEGSGQMRNEVSSIWRRIGFKIIQILIASHISFISFRTLEYTKTGRGSSGTNAAGNPIGLDLDLVPMMVVVLAIFATAEVISYLIFDAAQQLNIQVYNQSLKLRGKKLNGCIKILSVNLLRINLQEEKYK